MPRSVRRQWVLSGLVVCALLGGPVTAAQASNNTLRATFNSYGLVINNENSAIKGAQADRRPAPASDRALVLLGRSCLAAHDLPLQKTLEGAICGPPTVRNSANVGYLRSTRIQLFASDRSFEIACFCDSMP